MSKNASPLPKYIFVTGGVVSGLGKGITAASIGRLLINRGLRVSVQKLDPYLNVDPGTMNPFRHGEVFVTDDGTETDLDIGHYERFIGRHLGSDNSFTMGKIYSHVIAKERKGDFLGRDVQVVPHVTDEIKSMFRKAAKDSDIVIVEIGGTVGEIEGMTPMEAVRQFKRELGPKGSVSIHVTLVPVLATNGEIKTKPTQNSVKDLNRLGVYPDLIVCRTSAGIELDEETKEKLAMFCNLDSTNEVIHNPNCSTIYEVPVLLKNQKVDDIILKKLGLKAAKDNLAEWKAMVKKMQYKNGRQAKTIAIVGKYVAVPDADLSVMEAIRAASLATDTRVEIKLVSAEDIESVGVELLDGVDGIVIPGGFGGRGIEGKITTLRHARENEIPLLGICLGMQMAVIEFARNVVGLAGANSTEMNPDTPHPIIDLMASQENICELGGTMRLGLYKCDLKEGTLARNLYGKNQISERHRHRYEFNCDYKQQLENHGMVFSGINPESNLVEIIELSDHPFFIASQFHPELLSKPYKAHPLFIGLLEAVK
ncbi:MAG: CTP synthase [Firmicutes bacterium]|nr:CTP synthase [Bacillota bacterium]